MRIVMFLKNIKIKNVADRTIYTTNLLHPLKLKAFHMAPLHQYQCFQV